MFFTPFAFLFGFSVGLVNAHFRLQFPTPRGAFVAQQELDFCGGYTDAVSNRTSFPLSGGMFSIDSGPHPNFVVGVMLSTSQNPNTWEAFNNAGGQQQFVRSFARETNAGIFCIPLELNSTGISGVQEGANVTIQIVFAGGDGNLYQCADLTLARNASVPSCTNQTSNGHNSGSSGTNDTSESSDSNNASACSFNHPLAFSFSLLVVTLSGFITVFL
ncbi:hypothetical protein L218DRAFT_35609 [Marasmius fiardii PR-910]|nr:hypothetical protein L218DRAFT_35609 [Marasmius fiardii PR-910]